MSSLLKKLSQKLRSPWAILIVLLIVVVFLMQYSSSKSNILSAMTDPVTKTNPTPKKRNSMDGSSSDDVKVEPSLKTPNPAMPIGLNSVPASAGDPHTISRGVPQGCSRQPVTNPADLLPKDSNSEWSQLNTSGGGELANINLLRAGHHAGIDTVGSSLRNANLQVRSEPPNPHNNVSPWLNSTIEPDLMRIPLELGAGPL